MNKKIVNKNSKFHLFYRMLNDTELKSCQTCVKGAGKSALTLLPERFSPVKHM